MENQNVMIIDSYRPGRELVSLHFEDLGVRKDRIYHAETYGDAEKIIDIFNLKRIPYIAIFDSSLREGYGKVCTSNLVKKVKESDNIAVLLSADTYGNLSDGLKKLICDNKLHHVTKSSEILGCAKTFYRTLLASSLARV